MTFFETIDQMVVESEVVIDRSAGSVHPRFADYIYPFDYGYLAGTTSGDGAGIDCWVGSAGGRRVSGVIVVVDPIKKDSEIKILLGCTDSDMETILACHNRGAMRGMLVKR